ncbi:MAG: ATP-binding protein [Candidatus Bathyarchaeota archaeon]|nr:ATP-binding protein [Candidatus Bathyarchaeota archaeon]
MELILLNLLLAVINSFIAAYIALTRPYRRARIVMFLLTGASLWAYGYAMEMYFTTLSAKLVWAKVQLIGLSIIMLWPLLIAHLTENKRFTGRKGIALFTLPGLAMLILLATNDSHGLIFREVSINYLGTHLPLLKEYGIGFTSFLLYGYAVIISSSLYALRKFVKDVPALKNRLYHVAALVVLPVFTSMYYNFLSTNQYIDYSPTLNSLTCIGLLLFVPSEFRIGDIMPLEYASILGKMSDAVLIIDQTSTIIHCNPAARRIIKNEFDLPPDDVEGRSINSLAERVEIIGHADNPTEVIVNGLCFDLSSFDLRDWRGRPASRCLIFRDVSERRNLENKLSILNYYASSIAKAENFEDLGSITENALKNSLGFSHGVLILRDGDDYSQVQTWGEVSENIPDVYLGRLSKITQVTTCGLVDFISETPCTDKCAGSDMAMLCVPIIDNMNPRGVICIIREPEFVFDENQRRLLEIFGNHIASAVHIFDNENVLKAVQKEEIKRILEGAGRVSNMVRHDLRSPLQTIRNAAFILHKDPTNEKMIRIINESIEYMVKIIEDLVYTENYAHLDLRTLNLNTLIQQSLNQMLKPTNIQVEQNLYPEPLEGYFDKIKIQRMLNNLFKNAFEAMPKGGTLTIETRRSDNEVIVTVKDTGSGIKDTEKLFTPFHTTKLNGMGLGLISVKQTIEVHHGTIEVDSKLGEGTCFTLHFPVGESYAGNNTTMVNTIINT